MSNIIKVKKGVSTPTTSNIVDSEIAYSSNDKKLYINDAGVVTPVVPNNLQPDWNQATTTSDDFIKNKPTSMTPSAAKG